MSKHVMPTYRRTDLRFDRGEGSWLVTENNERYLDFGSGIAVTTLGHNHPALIDALEKQAHKLWHVSNIYNIPAQEKLADTLCAQSFADHVFFCNSGTEAIEGVIKTIRKYFAHHGQPQRHKILTFKGAFHGRTLGALAATGNAAYLDGFGPALPGFVQIEAFDIELVKAAIDAETAAILIEPIQGEGGVRSVGGAFLQQLRALADAHDLLLAFDEVQCGIARTGALFAHHLFDVVPDVMAIAKGLGGGFPVGAFLATAKASVGMVAGTHGSTYGGNPLAMSVSQAVIDIVGTPAFLEDVCQKALHFKQGLSRILDSYPQIVDGLRGEGLMLGLHCVVENTKIVEALRDEYLLSVGAGENTIRLVPPLNVTKNEIDIALGALERACHKLAEAQKTAD
ncbi:aspartate aminotransferase family protein [Alphaproteobacteria bacterium]|nr:aspartate aminotransferase family protein [Alphaproteobacteria bacterium]